MLSMIALKVLLGRARPNNELGGGGLLPVLHACSSFMLVQCLCLAWGWQLLRRHPPLYSVCVPEELVATEGGLTAEPSSCWATGSEPPCRDPSLCMLGTTCTTCTAVSERCAAIFSGKGGDAPASSLHRSTTAEHPGVGSLDPQPVQVLVQTLTQAAGNADHQHLRA